MNDEKEKPRTMYCALAVLASRKLSHNEIYAAVSDFGKMNFLFGPFVVDPLKEALSHTEDPELCGLAAMVLLKLGDKTGIPALLEIISSHETLLCQAAASLAEAQVVVAGDRMIERLRALEFTKMLHVYGIQCLLIALKELGRTFPPDLVARFQSSDAPWEVRIYLQKLSM